MRTYTYGKCGCVVAQNKPAAPAQNASRHTQCKWILDLLQTPEQTERWSEGGSKGRQFGATAVEVHGRRRECVLGQLTETTTLVELFLPCGSTRANHAGNYPTTQAARSLTCSRERLMSVRGHVGRKNRRAAAGCSEIRRKCMRPTCTANPAVHAASTDHALRCDDVAYTRAPMNVQ